MKRLIFLTFLLQVIVSGAIAQNDCYTRNREKGIAAYNAGNYETAMKVFNYALNTCTDTPKDNDIQSWIKQCDDKIKNG